MKSKQNFIYFTNWYFLESQNLMWKSLKNYHFTTSGVERILVRKFKYFEETFRVIFQHFE